MTLADASGGRSHAGGTARAGESAGAEPTVRGGAAALESAFVALGGATILLRTGQRGPLAVQRPFSPEGRGVSHVTLLHPPGGLVGGDRLSIGVEVGEGAHAVITTPAAAKHYRSAGPTARQQQHFRVAGGGTLEWLPHETILFDGAISELHTRVELAAGASFVGMDLVCFGLPARAERFVRGRCRQRLELWRGEHPLFIERGDFDGSAPVHAARWGLGGAPIMGTLLAAPGLPVDHSAIAAIRELAATMPGGDLAAVTRLDGGDGGPGAEIDRSLLCCRYIGGSAERGARYLRAAWRLLRPPLLGRPAVPPRIWST
jgi:urease accessory protein